MKITNPRVSAFALLAGAITVSLCGSAGAESRSAAKPYVLAENGAHSVFWPSSTAYTRMAEDECCTEPGADEACWIQDGYNEKAFCSADTDCDTASGSAGCNTTEKRCKCDDDQDCGKGVCDTATGLCGPSWCNGYYLCDCWGGCKWWDDGPACTNEGDCPDPANWDCVGTTTKTCKQICANPSDCKSGICEGSGATKYCLYAPADACELMSLDCEDGHYPDDYSMFGYCTDATPDTDTGTPDECTAANAQTVCQTLKGDPLGAPCSQWTCVSGNCVTTEVFSGSYLPGNCLDGTLENKCCCTNANAHCPGSLQNSCLIGTPTCDMDPASLTYHQCNLNAFWKPETADCSTALIPNTACTERQCAVAATNNPPMLRECVTIHKPQGTECPPGAGPPPPCYDHICSGPAGYDDDADGVTDVAADTCFKRTSLYDKTTCQGSTDSCGRKFCKDGLCDYGKNMGDYCVPNSTINYCFDYTCGGTPQACVQDDYRVALNPDGSIKYTADTTWEYLEPLGETCATPIPAMASQQGDSGCADADMGVIGATTAPANPRFGTCIAGQDYADLFYTYTDVVNRTAFALKRSQVVLKINQNGTFDVQNDRTDNVSWNPLLYTRTSCSTGSSVHQYTCNDNCQLSASADVFDNTNAGIDCHVAGGLGTGPYDAVVTAGPWALHDRPRYVANGGLVNDWDGNSFDDGFEILDTQSVFVAADSKASTPPFVNGGEFQLDVTQDLTHNNNDCRNNGAYVAAPISRGAKLADAAQTQVWKDRFRGSTVGYTNFLSPPNKSSAISAGCWSGGVPTASDPGQAFFRLELARRTADTATVTGRTADYKVYVDEAGLVWNANGWKGPLRQAPAGNPNQGTSFWSQTLAFWGSGATPDGNCLTAITGASAPSCLSGSDGYPRERVFDTSTAAWNGYAEVANRVAGKRGSYELNVLKIPQPFLGFVERFNGDGADFDDCGCGGSGLDVRWFPLEGYRLDMVPTNNHIAGHLIVSSATATGTLDNTWLFDPARTTATGALEYNTRCVGDRGFGPSPSCFNSMGPFPLPFAFPYSGQTFKYYCINAAGSVTFRRNSTDSCPAFDRDIDSRKLHGQYDDPTAARRGYAPQAVPLWGLVVPCWRSYRQRDMWGETADWSRCRSSDPAGGSGRIVTHVAPFEGTLALIVTWIGFDGYNFSSTGRTDVNNALNFQAIIRIDGRITYFYHAPPSSSAWDDIIQNNGWMVGLAGTRAKYCGDFSNCNTNLGGTSLTCDTTDYSGYYTAADFCWNNLPANSLLTGISGP